MFIRLGTQTFRDSDVYTFTPLHVPVFRCLEG